MAEPDLEALFASANIADFDLFKAEPASARNAYDEDMDKRAADLASRAARLFDSDDGRAVLEWLLDATLRRSTFVAQLGLPMDQAYGYGCLREGQNAIVHTILSLIAKGRKDQTPPPRDK